MKYVYPNVRRSAVLWLALLVLSACQGAGIDADGSNGEPAEVLLGPVIAEVMIPAPSGPAPGTCQGGAPALPYAFTDGGDTLMIAGVNFQQGARVRVGKERLLEAGVVNVTATSIEVLTPPGSPGDTDVVVINPDNQFATQRAAIRLCARSGATLAGAQVVAYPPRVQVGDQVNVELQAFPGDEDDLRDLRPLIDFDPSGFAEGDLIAGPLPAGADLLVGDPPAVFRYSFLGASEGEFVLNGTTNAINAELGNNVVIGPVVSNIVRVEPLLTSASVDRTSAALDQLIRLTVQVANAGSQTIRHIRGEGTDPDGDAGPIPPEPIPTVSGNGDLTLRSVSAVIVSGEGECRADVDPDGDTGPLPVLPACDLEPASIARFEYVFAATLPGFVSFEANAASVLTFEPAGTLPTRVEFTTPPPAEIVARSPWPELVVEVLDDTGRRVTSFADTVTIALSVGTDVLQGMLTATAVEGVARFPGLVYDTSEEIELTASSATVVGASDTAIVDLLPFGEPAQLAFNVPPRTAETVDFPWPSFSVRVLDLYGNLVTDTDLPVTVQRSSGTGKFSGLRTKLPELGVATFTSLRYDTAESMTLQVSATGTSPLVGVPVDVFSNAPAQLVLTSPVPTTVPQGQVWPSFSVVILDGAGTAPITNAGPITVSLSSGSGTLGGTTMSAPAIKSFTPSNLTYDVAEPITLDITAPGLTGILGIPVTVEPAGTVADHLTVAVAPRAIEVAGVIWDEFVVRVEDASGALVTSANGALEAVLTSGTGSFDDNVAQLTNGVARFKFLRYDTAEMIGFDITWAEQPGVTPVTGLVTDVAAAGPTQLGFGIAPMAMQEAGTFWPPFTVEIQDASGRRIPGASGSVTLSLATGSDTLDGTLTRQVVNGSAVFSGISYDLVELIEFNADSAGLIGITMEPIDVTAATPLRLLVHEAPRALETTGATWAPFAARIAGSDGRLARGASDTVTLGVASGGGGGALSGTLSLSAVDGIATFADIGFDTASGVQVSFTGTGIQESPRSFITVLAEGTTPVRMRFEDPAPPFEAVGGLWQPFSLRIEDEEGRLVTNPAMPVAVTIELTSGTGMITGTTTRTAVEGIVTFYDLRYDTAENISYDFTAAGLERLFGTARGLSRSIGIITIRANP